MEGAMVAQNLLGNHKIWDDGPLRQVKLLEVGEYLVLRWLATNLPLLTLYVQVKLEVL